MENPKTIMTMAGHWPVLDLTKGGTVFLRGVNHLSIAFDLHREQEIEVFDRRNTFILNMIKKGVLIMILRARI